MLPLRQLPATNALPLAIGLPLRNQDELDALIKQIYDPASPNYRHYLTPAQFTAQFGPTETDYQAVIDFAKTNGLTVTGTHANRTLLDVVGSVADIEKVFHVTLQVYRHPWENRNFYAPDVEPSVALAVPLLAINGLNNYSLPRPLFRQRLGQQPFLNQFLTGSGPSGNYWGRDFHNAYAPGAPHTGSGQSAALFECDGYFANDIATYASQAGLPGVTLTNVLIDGYNGIATVGDGANLEVALDIEMLISLAPGLSKILVYEGATDNAAIDKDILTQIADDNLAKQISASWIIPPSSQNDQVYKQFAMQGQSFFQACGDEDAYYPNIFQYQDSAFVTLVGGTTLTMTSTGVTWSAETVWNWGGGTGTGGGISTNVPIPTWQQSVSMAANQGSSVLRNIPDVALTADGIYVVADNGLAYTGVGGTSCAAPLWAAFAALVNQQAAANGASPVGFINPAVYAIGQSANYSNCFHDITTGNNESSSSPSKFKAVSGYDLCTGWGTPTGTNLINALVGPPTNAPVLVASSAIVTGGNGNGAIDSDECNLLGILVQNIGGGIASNVSATLSTTTPGVTITQPGSSYPNVMPDTATTNSSLFQVSTSPSFVCGTQVSLSLALTYAGGSTTTTLSLATCPCPGVQINGGLTPSSPTQTGRLTRLYTISTCSASKTCPGYLTTSGAYPYQAYQFTNTTSGTLCISVAITTPCDGQSTTGLFTVAYQGNFNPRSLCSGYLADQGGMVGTSGSYSFDVPANTVFTVVVNVVSVASYCSSFTLTVAGLPCTTDGGGACAGISASFTGTPTTGTAPLPVTFTDTSSGSITNRFWDFGDSTTTNTTTNTVVHTYAAGTDTVELVVAGPGGMSTNTKPNYITVYTPFQAWQIQYFGSTTNPAAAASADPDGDGCDNLCEFLSGTDPTNSASSFRITSIVNTGADVLINWMTGIGRTNALQAVTETGDGGYDTNGFANIFSVTNTTGPLTNYLDVGAATNLPTRFYRVRLVP